MMGGAPSGPGALVVSLDFELYWGVRDSRTLAEYGPNLLGVRKAVPRMLEMFSRYGIRATWATVGFLFCSGREELMTSLPSILPRYRDPRLSPYPDIPSLGEDEHTDPYHFAPSLVREIASCPGQEIATHTFSHYYCLEPGQDRESFRADLRAAVRIASKWGLTLRSLVFPRNQCNFDYLPIARDEGIRAFRGNPRAWIYSARNTGSESVPRRLGRLLDAYFPLSGHHAHSRTVPQSGVPLDVPASRFLRPFSRRLRAAEFLRLKRIAGSMAHTAENGKLFHLWWHPHNFGRDLEANMEFLEALCRQFVYLRGAHGFESLGMAEAAGGFAV